MSEYLFSHEDKAYTPDGLAPLEVSTDSVDARNKETERIEIDWLKTGPDHVFLYVHFAVLSRDATGRATVWARSGNGENPSYIMTWLGTRVSESCYFGRSSVVGGIAGYGSRKRSVDCRIYGVRYVGWFYESAGAYCRLRKAKVQ
jgi:hypothetical protein